MGKRFFQLGGHQLEELVQKNYLVLEKSFFSLSFMHISREYNREADSLSKLATSCVSGNIFFQEVIEGMISVEGSLFIIQ